MQKGFLRGELNLKVVLLAWLTTLSLLALIVGGFLSL